MCVPVNKVGHLLMVYVKPHVSPAVPNTLQTPSSVCVRALSRLCQQQCHCSAALSHQRAPALEGAPDWTFLPFHNHFTTPEM